MKSFIAAAVLCATALSATADTLPNGTLITGTLSGASTSLLGLDHGFADEAGSNITALSGTELEFLSGDYALGIDFTTDGSLLIYGNTDNGALPGSYTLTFSFAGLASALSSFLLTDTSHVSSGSVSAQLLSGSTVQITLSNVVLDAPFTTIGAQAVSAVPEPAAWAFMAAGLGLLALRGTGKGEQA